MWEYNTQLASLRQKSKQHNKIITNRNTMLRLKKSQPCSPCIFKCTHHRFDFFLEWAEPVLDVWVLLGSTNGTLFCPLRCSVQSRVPAHFFASREMVFILRQKIQYILFCVFKIDLHDYVIKYTTNTQNDVFCDD